MVSCAGYIACRLHSSRHRLLDPLQPTSIPFICLNWSLLQSASISTSIRLIRLIRFNPLLPVSLTDRWGPLRLREPCSFENLVSRFGTEYIHHPVHVHPGETIVFSPPTSPNVQRPYSLSRPPFHTAYAPMQVRGAPTNTLRISPPSTPSRAPSRTSGKSPFRVQSPSSSSSASVTSAWRRRRSRGGWRGGEGQRRWRRGRWGGGVRLRGSESAVGKTQGTDTRTLAGEGVWDGLGWGCGWA